MAPDAWGVVAMTAGEPVSVAILVADPGLGGAVVKVLSYGVSHTDLHDREGGIHLRGDGINDEFPTLLGHEAAGTIEAVGADVTTIAPGDFVVLHRLEPGEVLRSVVVL